MALVRLLMLLTLARPTFCSDARLTISIEPEDGHIVPGQTVNIIITCELDFTLDGGLDFIVITKKVGNDSVWIAKVDRNTFSSNNTLSPIEVIGSTDEPAFLNASWPIASVETYGTYYCHAQSSKEYKKTKNLSLGSETELWKVMVRLDRQVKSCGGSIYAESHNQSSAKWDHGRIVWKSRRVFPAPDFPQDVSILRTQLWPSGKYALLSPATGCPSQKSWKTGRFRQPTSSEYSSSSKLSELNHLHRFFFSTYERSNSLVDWKFCVKTKDSISYTWPKGSYCIFSFGFKCPHPFQRGSVTTFDENDVHRSRIKKIFRPVPDTIKATDRFHTVFTFCCRKDGTTDDVMFLPFNKPFYLFRNTETCQKVYGTRSSNEFIQIGTRGAGSQSGSLPSIVRLGHSFRLNLCYYSLTGYDG